MLVHLPNGYRAEQVAPALTAKIKTLPEALCGSLTWDQGVEMRDWKQVAVAADIAIFFCDPHSPWQRATNENTNGLLRQYFPKGTDLSCTRPPTWTGSPPSSTTGPASVSASANPSSRSASCRYHAEPWRGHLARGVSPARRGLPRSCRSSPCRAGGVKVQPPQPRSGEEERP